MTWTRRTSRTDEAGRQAAAEAHREHPTFASTNGAPGDPKARAAVELLGDIEVSLSGRSYHGAAESIDHMAQSYTPGPPSLPPSSPEAIRMAAEIVAHRLHRAPLRHWEAGRGGTFIHNHPDGAAMLSPKDIETAAVFNFRTMVVVSRRDGILIVQRPRAGWQSLPSRPASFAEHDTALRQLGATVKRRPLADLPTILDDAERAACRGSLAGDPSLNR